MSFNSIVPAAVPSVIQGSMLLVVSNAAKITFCTMTGNLHAIQR